MRGFARFQRMKPDAGIGNHDEGWHDANHDVVRHHDAIPTRAPTRGPKAEWLAHPP